VDVASAQPVARFADGKIGRLKPLVPPPGGSRRRAGRRKRRGEDAHDD
jgi:hypothetical protein